jgi:hypothetical protein
MMKCDVFFAVRTEFDFKELILPVRRGVTPLVLMFTDTHTVDIARCHSLKPLCLQDRCLPKQVLHVSPPPTPYSSDTNYESKRFFQARQMHANPLNHARKSWEVTNTTQVFISETF